MPILFKLYHIYITVWHWCISVVWSFCRRCGRILSINGSLSFILCYLCYACVILGVASNVQVVGMIVSGAWLFCASDTFIQLCNFCWWYHWYLRSIIKFCLAFKKKLVHMSFVVTKVKRRKGMVFNHLIFPLIVFSLSLSLYQLCFIVVLQHYLWTLFSLWNSTGAIFFFEKSKLVFILRSKSINTPAKYSKSSLEQPFVHKCSYVAFLFNQSFSTNARYPHCIFRKLL